MITTGENATRVETQGARGSQSSAVANVGDNDRARSNGQVDQTSRDAQIDLINQSQASMASAVELSRGGENQQQGPRMKQENKT